jgi:hypothetical protein
MDDLKEKYEDLNDDYEKIKEQVNIILFKKFYKI